MEGAALAAERKIEKDLLVAHQGAAWTGAAFAGKLKPFRHYRPIKKDEEVQGTDEILSAMLTLQSLGAPMNIERVN
jgi:hypothetical protein